MPDSPDNIRILTYHRTTNPGGVLFSLSLAKLLTGEFPGQDVRILDYMSTRKRLYEGLKIAKPQTSIPWFNVSRYLRYMRYVTRELPLDTGCPRLPTTRQLVEYLNSMSLSATVVGMDTWNLADEWFLERFPNIYWLPRRIRGARIAYAVSAHRSQRRRIAANSHQLREALNAMDMIGVRDHFTREMISHLGLRGDLPVRKLMDPTFLFPIAPPAGAAQLERWGLDPGRPVLGLLVHGHDALVRAVNQHFRGQGFQIVAPSIFNPHADINLGHVLDPDQWAGLFQRMAFCVTDRYHGAIFCLKSRTPFLSIEPGMLESPLHSKHRSLLLDFGLLDCHVARDGISLGEIKERVEHVQTHWQGWIPTIEVRIGEVKRQHADFLAEMKRLLSSGKSLAD
jgi:hypothetical protein